MDKYIVNVDVSGNKFRKFNNIFHCKDGPAVEWFYNSDKFWFNEKGKLHREDGPAAEYESEGDAWFLNGFELTEDEYLNRTKRKWIPEWKWISTGSE